jgi:hypothetical protein
MVPDTVALTRMVPLGMVQATGQPELVVELVSVVETLVLVDVLTVIVEPDVTDLVDLVETADVEETELEEVDDVAVVLLLVVVVVVLPVEADSVVDAVGDVVVVAREVVEEPMLELPRELEVPTAVVTVEACEVVAEKPPPEVTEVVAADVVIEVGEGVWESSLEA